METLLALIAILAFLPQSGSSQPSPRKALPKAPLVLAPLPELDAVAPAQSRYRLIAKFTDSLRVRATPTGGLRSESNASLTAVEELARSLAMSFSPLIASSEALLSALEARAQSRSFVAQPDLAGMVIVELPAADGAALLAAGEALQRLPEIEFAYVQTLGVPPPGDIAPPTPDHVGLQTYRGPNPGMNVDQAWLLGLKGAGRRLSDCEYGWNAAHEDLNDLVIHPEPGQTPHPSVAANGWDEHGTAVLGETSAVVNAYGCSGMASDASVYTFPEWTIEGGSRRVTAITNAIAGSAVGDVVLLEMQAVGAGGGYGPAELDPAVWTVCKVGTDAGVIVVGAAGNGDQNLDSGPYAPYMAWGDSGAILVGAGTPDLGHHKQDFSTYGSRVNVQGWGSNAFSLGYGNVFQYGGDKNQRYTYFSGTSSASPFIASACTLLEQRAQQVLGAPLAPLELRNLLVSTGIPQGSGGHIGPLPNLPVAIAGICSQPETYCTAKTTSGLTLPAISWTGTPSQAANNLVVTLSDAVPNKTGLVFWGPQPASAPFQGGFLCVGGSTARGPATVISSTGAASTAIAISAPMVGTTSYYQWWFRDPASPSTTGLSDGLQVIFCP
jgi:hypothetical protein